MDFTNILFSLSSMGPFASRIFLPAFLSALLLRFGNHIPLIEHFGILAMIHPGAPTWFTANPTLIVLGVLAAAEVLSHKSSEARLVLQEVDIYLKPAMAALTVLGFINATDAGFVRQITHQAGVAQGILPLIAAMGTFQLAAVRKKVLAAVVNHFEGTRLVNWLSWAEDCWVLLAVIFMFVFAVLALIAIAGAIAMLLVVRKRWEIAEEQRRVPCVKCGKAIYPCAVSCGSCGYVVAQPVAIGFLGQSKPKFATDLPHHPYRLMEKRRCPVCAAHLPVAHATEPCPACAKTRNIDPDFIQAYSNYINRRVAPVLALCAVISVVPFVGMIVGSVYYEIVLVIPYSQYLPIGRRFLLRWKLRLLFFVLAVLQLIPLIGSVSVPLSALISFAAYRKSYRNMMLGSENHPRAVGVPGALPT